MTTPDITTCLRKNGELPIADAPADLEPILVWAISKAFWKTLIMKKSTLNTAFWSPSTAVCTLILVDGRQDAESLPARLLDAAA